MVAGVTTSGKNEWGQCCCERQWWRERGSCICVIGGELDDSRVGKVTYVGGLDKVYRAQRGLEEMQRMMSEITSNVLTMYKLWYSLKYE